MSFLVIAPVTLALWVVWFSVWTIWRQVLPILEYGIWDVRLSTSVLVISTILLGLSVGLLHTIRTESDRATKIFGALAVMVATPPIFIGARTNLPVFGYSYYAGFDWIASEKVQLAWLALVVLSVLYFTHRTIVREPLRTEEKMPVRSSYQIWMMTLYWVLTAWFTVLALNAISPFWSQTWIELFEDITSGESFRLRFSPQSVLIVAIALGLWLRSGATIWLVSVWVFAFHFSSFFNLAKYYPKDHTNSPPKDYWLNHPALILSILLAVILLQRAKVIRAI